MANCIILHFRNSSYYWPPLTLFNPPTDCCWTGVKTVDCAEALLTVVFMELLGLLLLLVLVLPVTVLTTIFTIVAAKTTTTAASRSVLQTLGAGGGGGGIRVGGGPGGN